MTNHIALVLDESGSMNLMREEAIELFNAQRSEIQNSPPPTTVTFIKFGGERPVETVFEGEDPDEVPVLSHGNYLPMSLTPLRDAIGRAISILEGLGGEDEDSRFLIVTVTDGQENHSQEWSKERLHEKTRQLEETGRWEFKLFGTDTVSHEDMVRRLGTSDGFLPDHNYVQYTATRRGFTEMTVANTSAIADWTSGGE